MSELIRYYKQKRDTAANWTSNNPTLKDGQIGLEKNGSIYTRFKVGDGVTAWNALAYFIISSGEDLATVLSAGNTTGGQKIIVSAGDYIQYTDATASRVAVYDSNKRFTYSTVTTTELAYVSGVTSAIQTQLNGKEGTVTAGTTSQYYRGDKTFQTLNTTAVIEGTNLYFTEARVRATVLTGLSISGSSISATDSILTAFGKIQNQINGVLGGAIYQGVWNASTNSPTLADGTGTKGYYYVVSVAGTQNLGSGAIDFQVGDWAIHNGTIYQKVDNTDAVSSVNGTIGAVVITVTGTSNRISVSGGGGLTPTIDIDTAYVGQTSITTLGTVATGTWNATVIADGKIAAALTGKTYNGLTITTTTGAFTLTNGKTLSVSNTLTLTGTDSSSVAFGTGGTVAYTANKLSVFAATTSAELAGVISDETGSGILVFATSPTFTTDITTPKIIGATTSGGTLTLTSTSHATKGNVYFGSSTGLNYDETNKFLGIGTIPTSFTHIVGNVPTSSLIASYYDITSLNANAVNILQRLNLKAGVTTATNTIVCELYNACAGTGTDLSLASVTTNVNGNVGTSNFTYATTTGYNVGGFFEASAGALSIGVIGKSITTKNSGTNIGVLGTANNTGTSPILIGGYFALASSSTPSFTGFSSALVAVATANPVFIGAYDTSNYYKTTVSSMGAIVFDAVGSGAQFTFNDNLIVASGKTFTLGNAAVTGLVAGALAALTNATIVIYDSTGQAYRIPCVI